MRAIRNSWIGIGLAILFAASLFFFRGSQRYSNLFNSDNCLIVCSPSIFLTHLNKNEKNLFSGAQDVSIYNEGAYTGELSARMLADNNIKFCLVGHSERRQYFSAVSYTHLTLPTKRIV